MTDPETPTVERFHALAQVMADCLYLAVDPTEDHPSSQRDCGDIEAALVAAATLQAECERLREENARLKYDFQVRGQVQGVASQALSRCQG